MEILLDPLKKQLDLPALLVKLGDSDGLECKVIGKKNVGLAGFSVDVLYAA